MRVHDSQVYRKMDVTRERISRIRVYMPLGASFSEDVPLVEFKYLVFTRTPGGVIVGDSGLCRCVPRLFSAIIFSFVC